MPDDGGRAHVPGRNPRHAEDAFDAVRALTPPAIASAQAAEVLPWRAGLQFMAEARHWEAHEVIEPVWMAAGPETAERAMAQAAIQLANGALKLTMGRFRAALRLADIAEALTEEAGPAMGLSPRRFAAACRLVRTRARAADDRPLPLPVAPRAWRVRR